MSPLRCPTLRVPILTTPRISGMALRRIQKELQDIAEEKFAAGPVGSDMYNWEATLFGPQDTPYEGGQFTLKIKFPPDYPFKPPTITFATKIYHPNVSNGGEICAGMIKDQWNPAMSISKVLNSLISMLAEPNADQAINMEVAHVLKNDPKKFAETAKQWTKSYAS